MVYAFRSVVLMTLCLVLTVFPPPAGASVRIKEVARIDGVRDNPVVGYGLVVGLAGTGDSPRSAATMRSVANTLEKFGVAVPAMDVRSRNTAAVIVTATLGSFAQGGDKLDVNVSSLGDARSLVGGTLLLTPLRAANDRVYALAQGPLSVGGFKYDMYGNVVQKNHSNVGIVPSGATVEQSVNANLVGLDGRIGIILHMADFTTATRIKEAVNTKLGRDYASVTHAGRVDVAIPAGTRGSVAEFISHLESIAVEPDRVAKVVVNERSGTVVAGGEVQLDAVSISHAGIKVTIATDYDVSQPSFVEETGSGVRSVVVPSTEIAVEEDLGANVSLGKGATVTELVEALRMARVGTRDVITILQSIHAAGALHSELLIQ